MAKAPEVCHWQRADDGYEFLMPYCLGGACNGPDACTCNHPLSESEQQWRDKFIHSERKRKRAEEYLRWAKSSLKEAGLRSIPFVGEIDKMEGQADG